MSKPKTPAEQAQVDAEVRPDSSPPAAKPAAKEEPTTPEYWAGKLGHVAKKASPLDVNGKRRPLHFDVAHAAADQLHGWSFHKLHTVDPLVLTEDAYKGALAAALKTDKAGHYVPHGPALSKFAQKRAEERAQRRAKKLNPKGGE